MTTIKSLDQQPKIISKITISLANPDVILKRSHGEVTKPETINYRSFRPEKDGLFCEKIFGPTRDWECHCGKYKRIRYKGIICDRCGVEVTTKSVRRERMGHISLAVPVAHIWFFRSQPSKIGNVLGFNTKDLERIVYYETYVVINPGPTGLKEKDLITEEQYFEILSTLPPDNEKLLDDDPRKFVAKMGGEALKALLKKVDPEALSLELRTQLKEETSQQKKQEILKRLKIIEAFKPKEGAPENRPEWMIVDVVPVIPPELRPLVPLEGGRFATSDLNDLYRRVIIRNNRLKRLIEIKAPDVILRNEKRMLQEAVDALFDNSRRTNVVRVESNRALKSLSDILKGKQGRFRQNLLGKRVDYSGRSVIVVNPELKLHQCGLNRDMALELFKPFVINKLIERGYNKTVKSARKVIDKKQPIVWEILESIVDSHPVMLNRAPTLHRLGIQAFQPILVTTKAIEIHPMVCTAFNADFDGDQMAVHVPLSPEAILECQLLMLSSHNILSPQNGNPIVIPTQDIILGCYYLTKIKDGDLGEGKVFSSPDEVIIAYENKKVGLHARIKVRIDDELIETSVGRVIFNRIVPKEMGFINELLVKKSFGSLIGKMFRKLGNVRTAQFLDDLKDIGFKYATIGGISINIDDMVVPEVKWQFVERSNKEVKKVLNQWQEGYISEGERYNKIIDIWTHTTNNVADALVDTLKKSQNGFNPLWMMIDSGARGSKEQVRQLAGMRGLMAKPQKSLTGQAGEIIESPIISNFKEGLSVIEYFISTHGARKGLADTALKTADAGYLTRRLVDVAQDVVVTQYDCGTIRGVEITALKDGEEIREPLSERILGRVALEDIYDPLTNELLCEAGELITEEIAERIGETAIESVKIRTVLTCDSKRGVCAKCYGRNLTTGKLVDVGEAVGIIAAQSIGEPGTQLTLRTFHIGGAASRIVETSQVTSRFEGKAQFESLRFVEKVNEFGEKVKVSLTRNGVISIIDNDGRVLRRYEVPYGAEIVVDDGQKIEKGSILYNHDPYNAVIISEQDGIVEFQDMVENITFRHESDEQTGHIQQVVIEPRDKALVPKINITRDGEKVVEYIMPAKAHLVVREGQEITAGTILAKIPREIGKTRDITGGLPRVTELFEARKPHDPAIVAEFDGVISFGAQKKGTRDIIITSIDGLTTKAYSISVGKHVLVQNGDIVKAGDKLTDGDLDPHDILRIKGPNAVQEFLVNEIQEVYRLQGVKINDKHIEIIVKQMLQKVKILDPGDTKFLENDLIDKYVLEEENEKIRQSVVVLNRGDSRFKNGQVVERNKIRDVNIDLRKKNKKLVEYRDAQPATSEPILLGITAAALSTESFLSAASFQETTKVLTDAATEAKTDYLLGLKENVVIGHKIPAGTGLKKFRNIILTTEEFVESKVVTQETSKAKAK
ncbi:MAG: DNA-directed RNA polymerase subunit beta' [Ignavibacteria bacterium]